MHEFVEKRLRVLAAVVETVADFAQAEMEARALDATAAHVSVLRRLPLPDVPALVQGAAEPSRWMPIVTARRIAGVWPFFGVIHIWNVGPIGMTFTERTAFFLGLLGLA